MYALIVVACFSINVFSQQGIWKEKKPLGNNGPIPTSNGVGFSINGKGYVLTFASGSHEKELWQYDPSSNSWTQKTEFPGVQRKGAITFTIGNKAYVGTGVQTSTSTATILKDIWQYDADLNLWQRKGGFCR